MSEPSRLDKLRALHEWLQYQLRQTERTISQLEAEEAEAQRRREIARVETSWKLQPSRSETGQPMLHRGNCGLYKVQLGYLDREHVAVALEEFPELEWCEQCRPWGSLGVERPGT